jgi:hypothetical protein
MNSAVGTSPNIKKLKAIPNIGNKGVRGENLSYGIKFI